MAAEQQQVETLVVGYDDRATDAIDATTSALNKMGAAAENAGDQMEVLETQVRRQGRTGEQVLRQYGDAEKLTAKLTTVTRQYQRARDDLEASELSAARKAEERLILQAREQIAIEKAIALHEREMAAIRAKVAAADAMTRGAAAATASAGSWAGAMSKVYETAGEATSAVNGTARALQLLNADFQAGRASFAEWIAGARGLETALHGVSSVQKSINDNTGVSRQTSNVVQIGPLRHQITGNGASNADQLTLVTGDAEASARRLDDITAAFAEADQVLDRYRESLGLVDVAQRKYEVGLGELRDAIRRAGIEEAEGTRILDAYAAQHDPAVAKAAALKKEQEQLAASYSRVMAQLDPGIAAQQRYEAALATLRAGAAAAGRSEEELAADIERFTAVLSPAAIATRKEEDALRSLLGTLDKNRGTTELLAQQQAMLDKAYHEGIGNIRLTEAEYRSLSAVVKEHHDLATRSATSTKLAAHEMTNLTYQIQDAAVQLAGGQNPFLILVQQGPQATGAVGGVSRAVALLMSPVTLAIVGVTALVGAMALVIGRAAQVSAHTRQLTVDIQAMGNASGVTATQLRGIEAQMRQQGVSSDAAYASVRTLAGARGLPAGMIGDVVSLSRDMAASTGDVAGAVKTLTDALTEGYQGIRKLDDQFNFLTASERKQIETMARHGDQAGMLSLAVGALHRQFDGLHEKSLSPLDAAFERLTAAYNRLLDAMASRPIVIKGLEGLAWLLEKTSGGLAPTRAEQIAGMRQELGQLEAQYARLPEKTAGVQAAHEQIILRRIELLQQLAKLEKEVAGAAPQTSTGAPRTAGTSNARSGLPDPAAAKYVEEQAAAYDRLSEAMRGNAVQRTLAQADLRAEEEIRDRRLRGAAADDVRDLRRKEALLQLNVAVADAIRGADAEVRGNELLAQAYGVSSAAVREAAIHQKALVEVARGTIEPYDQIVDRLRKVDDAQRALQAAQFDATLKQQTEDAQRLAAAWAKGAAAAREATLANEVLAEARRRGLDPRRDGDEIAGLVRGVAARDMAQRSAQLAQMAAEQRRAVELANAEWGMLGQSNASRAQQIAMLQAANDLRDKGVDLTDDGTKAYIRQAGELARVNATLQEAAQNAANIAQPITTGLEDIIVGTKKVGDAAKALGEDLKRIFTRALITKPFETLVTGELTKLMAGPVQAANDNTPRAANDSTLIERLVGQVNRGLGSSEANAMWVQVAGRASLAFGGLEGAAQSGGAIPVAVKDAGGIADLIKSEARAQGVPAEVALAIGKIESGFRQYRPDGGVNTSSAGAQGVMQLMPGTAKWLGVDASDTADNVRGGVKFLAMLGRQFGGDWTMAAAAYNAGPTRVQQYLTHGRALPAETTSYIDKFGKELQRAGQGLATMGTRVGGVTQAQEDALQAQLDAVDVAKGATSSTQDLTASQAALVASVLGTTTANDKAAETIAVQSRAISDIGENAISAADQLGDAADGAKSLANASDSAGNTLLTGAQAVYNGFTSVIGSIWNAVTGLFSSQSAAGGNATGGQPGVAGGMVSTGRSLVSAASSAYQIATGTNTLGTAATNFAMSTTGQSLGLATSAVGEMGPVIPQLTATGEALTGAAGTIGAAMPYGAIGGIGGSLIGNATGSKAVGALAGAALGAGSAGIGASIWGMGAVGGPWGIVAAAAISAIMAALGTQKPTVGPTASADITITTGGKSATAGNYLTDNDGDIQAAQQLGSAVSAIFSAAASGGGTLAKEYGIGRTKAKGLYVSGSVPYKEFGDDVAGLMRYTLLEQGGLLNAGPNVTAAIQNSKAKDLAESAKDIGLGASIDAGITAMAEYDKSLKGVTNTAKKAAAATYENAIAEKQRADGLGIGAAYADLVTRQIRESFDPVALTPLKSSLATLDGQFAALSDAIHTMGLAIGDGEIAAAKAAAAEKLLKAYRDEYDATFRAAQGLSAVDQAGAIRARWTTSWQDDLAAGRDPTLLYGAQMKALFGGISDLTVLNQAAAALQTLDSVAAGFAKARADEVRAATLEDLSLRQMAARVQLGEVTQDAYDRAALEVQQKRELATVTDAAVKAQLEQVQATERASQAAKSNSEAMAALTQSGKSLYDWLSGKLGTASAGISTSAAYSNALASYQADLGKAAANDNDALGRIANSADRLLTAYNGLYGSAGSTEFWRKIMGEVASLPAVKAADGYSTIVDAINKLPHAAGGPAAGLTMVNDAGPEMIRLPTGSLVMTSRASVDLMRRVAGTGGATTVVNDNSAVVEALQQVVRAIVLKAEDQQALLQALQASGTRQEKALSALRALLKKAGDSGTLPTTGRAA